MLAFLHRASGDLKSAQMLLAEKERFRDLERAYAGTHLDRLSGQSVRAIETSSLHLDIISDMRRINSFFCSTAYPILEQAGQLRRSRLRGDVTIFQGGACVLRRTMLESCARPDGPLPGRFVYGHEETDLAWRALDAGWHSADVEMASTISEFEVEDDWAAFARLGYRFTPNWRVEVWLR